MPDIGPITGRYSPDLLLRVLTVAGLAGEKGPSVEKRLMPIALLEDELIGKIGPIIDVYNPETTNRLTGEWG